MELILINDSKLKVMLTESDLASLSLTCDTIDYDNTETRRAFWEIFDEAKHRTGFDAASNRIFIQVFPSKSGGCELYVTKVQGEKDRSSVSVKVNQTKKNAKASSCIYGFDNIQMLTKACYCLDSKGFYEESSAFAEKEKPLNPKYFLILNENTPPSSQKKKKSVSSYDFIGEFGKKYGGSIMYYIKEHCEPVCTDDAVHTLGRLSKDCE